MAKRFIDTELFNDSWFMNLKPESKLFYVYLFTNCDHAGIIDLNIRLAEFQTGIKELSNSFETVIQGFSEKRIKHLSENYYLLPKFLSFQYPNGLNDSVKAHQSIIKRLSEFNINYETVIKGLGNSLITVQDKDIDKDKDKDKDSLKEGVGEKIDFKKLESEKWFMSIRSFLDMKVSYVDIIHHWKKYQEAMIADDDLYRTDKEYRSHFRNWIKFQVQKNGNKRGLMKPIGILNND